MAKPTAAKINQIAERRAKVAALALAYVPQYRIAQQLGVSPATVTNDLKYVRNEWRDDAVADRQEWVVRELESVNKLESRLWSDALHEYTPPDVRVRIAMGILKCKERRAKYLGLDQPDLIDVVITDDRIAAEIVELRERLGYEDRPALEA